MIKHFPPHVTAASNLNPQDLAHHTRQISDPLSFSPSQMITANYDAVIHGPLFRGKVNNTYYGNLYEICWWDALVSYGVPAGTIEPHVDAASGKHAEIDLLVHAPMDDVAILLKTSLRERWKQLDRDASLISIFAVTRRTDIWVVFYREQAADSAEKMVGHARRVERMFGTRDVKVRTVMDGNAMRSLFLRCGAAMADSEAAVPDGPLL